MNIEARGVIHKLWTEQTKNEKTIGHLVLHQGSGRFGEEYLHCKVLGAKTLTALESHQEGDKVVCKVDLKSNEARNGTGKWYTDAVCFYLTSDQGAANYAQTEDRKQAARDVKTRPGSQPREPGDDFE